MWIYADNDFGGVGMAVPDRIKLYRAQQLRSVGGNGRRMSHNPPQPSDLDIYDRLGVVVMVRELKAFDSTIVAVCSNLS
jgi:beta-galactosidase/beta-glucuronidase